MNPLSTQRECLKYLRSFGHPRLCYHIQRMTGSYITIKGITLGKAAGKLGDNMIAVPRLEILCALPDFDDAEAEKKRWYEWTYDPNKTGKPPPTDEEFIRIVNCYIYNAKQVLDIFEGHLTYKDD